MSILSGLEYYSNTNSVLTAAFWRWLAKPNSFGIEVESHSFGIRLESPHVSTVKFTAGS